MGFRNGTWFFEGRNDAILQWRLKRFRALGANIRMGRDVKLLQTENMEIGDNVFFGNECYFDAVSRISIGSGCMFGPRVFCIAGSHNYDSPDLKAVPYDNRQIDLPVVIGDNVWIGGNVSVAPGTRIGEGSVIALGAIVAGEIPPYSVVMSEKASVVKYRNKEMYTSLVAQGAIYNSVFAGKPFEIVDSA